MASQSATPKSPSVRLTDAAPSSGSAPVANASVNQEQDVEAPSSGFDGHVHCTSLADLIQLECLSLSRTVFCVMSQGRQGYLFFDEGKVAHATAGDLVQDDAALEMLSWDNGNFVQSEVEWPRRPAMTSPWQQLVMVSAHRADEARRSRPELAATETGKRVVGLPSRRTNPPPKQTVPLPARPSSMPPSPAPRVAGHAVPSFPVLAVPSKTRESVPPASDPPPAFVGAVCLGPSGEVLSARGQGQRVVALGAYVRRLCDLIGEDLGLGAVQEFDAQLSSRHVALFVDGDGSCIAVETLPGQMLRSGRAIFDDSSKVTLATQSNTDTKA